MPEYLFSYPVIIFTWLWAIIVHFADSINNQSGQYPHRIVIVTALHAFVFTSLYLINKFALSYLPPRRVPAAFFLSIAVIAIARGYLFETWLFNWDVVQSANYPMRMVSSFLNTTTTLTIATITYASVTIQSSARSRLLVEKDRLEHIETVAINSLNEIGVQVVEVIRGDLLKTIDEMEKSSTTSVLATLKKTIDDVVRPLSHHLSEAINPWTPPTIEAKKTGINWLTVFKESIRPVEINYVLVPFMMALPIVPTILTRSPVFEALTYLALVVTIGIFVGFAIHEIVAPRSNSWFLYLISTLVSGAAMGAASLPLTRDYNSPKGLLILAIIFYPLTSFIISFLTTAQRQNYATTAQLEQINNELAWNVARVRELQMQHQRVLAKTLHGEVQAKLAATYLQLQNASNTNADSPTMLKKLMSDLRGVVSKINEADEETGELRVVLQKVQSNWAEVAEIKVNADAATLTWIELDPVCTSILNDVIPELCFNGVKHGNAKNIQVTLSFLDDRTVALEVSNDGLTEGSASEYGFGSKLLNEASISWSRFVENGHTVTHAEFAYSKG